MNRLLVASGIIVIILFSAIFIGIKVNIHDEPTVKVVAENDTMNIPQSKNTHLKEGPTSDRPKDVPQGFVYFDTTYNKPLFWDGKLWVDVSVINLKDFGAKGDGMTDDTKAIQKALNIARDYGSVHINIPEGVYLTKTLRLYKNTNVTLDEKAVIKRIGSGYKLFVNGKSGDPNYAFGYNGEGNIHFSNGTIDLNSVNAPIPDEKSISAFDLGHADNLSFENLTIKNGQNGHYFQISSSRNVRFIGCWFGNVHYTNKSSKNFELIQIEEATKVSFPTFGGYDGTMSKNILIKDCHFENVIRAIGTHSYSRAKDKVTPLRYNENIRITHNVFKNSISQFGYFEGFKNVIIEDNVFEDYKGDPIYLKYTINSQVKNNRLIPN
ncbi:glycosyl hydrolase family 28-related protein [Neobacillus cucumis]|uniref:glycosyl hydrolase family 28-related protein n=1 Tax=Neobacillus cucumis TaxID=1740721 RepID=UPI002E1CE1F8|nr:glycosyl hydrolase family 28-related protein [Neobacillus cucumis]